MPGYWRKILRVDLTNRKTWTEEPDEAFYRKHMGGRGFIAHYLLSETPAGVDAFDPENRLIFAMGPLTGTPVPGAGRHSVGGKSPLTGGFGESEAGGFWGAELKKAGWAVPIGLSTSGSTTRRSSCATRRTSGGS
jgi:aldehyde:ferredoxin oxidoreductase